MEIATANKQQDSPAAALESPRSFAEYVNVTPQQVRLWCHAGKIPTRIYCGRVIRFDRAEALEALNKKEGQKS